MMDNFVTADKKRKHMTVSSHMQHEGRFKVTCRIKKNSILEELMFPASANVT